MLTTVALSIFREQKNKEILAVVQAFLFSAWSHFDQCKQIIALSYDNYVLDAPWCRMVILGYDEFMCDKNI